MVESIPPSRDVLLRHLVDVLSLSRPEGPLAIGIALLDGEVELAFKPFEGADILDGLIGFHAPSHWHAFAVASPATAHSLEGDQPSKRVTLTVLAARDGTTANAMLIEDEAEPFGDPSGDGRLLDACRRVLGLPTAPPEHSVAAWSVVHWMDAVVHATLARDLGDRLPWRSVRRLDRGRHLIDLPWSIVRGDCIAGKLRIPGLDPAAAQWMDDGMFSREAITAYPGFSDMLDDLRSLLAPVVYQRLLAVACARLEAHLPDAAAS